MTFSGSTSDLKFARLLPTSTEAGRRWALIPVGSGNLEALGFEGGAGNGALASREMGERFWAGEGLALDRGESGLCDEDECCGFDFGRELVCKGDGEICREPGAPEREATSDRAPR